MLNCKSKVRILAPDSDYVVRTAHPELVASMVSAKIARVEDRDKRGLVVSIRLTGELANNTARPGSYGIVRQVIDDGTHHSILFQHHRVTDSGAPRLPLPVIESHHAIDSTGLDFREMDRIEREQQSLYSDPWTVAA